MIMEFSSSFALINSGFDLAAKQPECEGKGLAAYNKTKNSRSLAICCKTVREAIDCSWMNNREENVEARKMKIAAVLFTKVQEVNEDEMKCDWTEDSDEDYFESVTIGLPAFNRTFLYDVVKNCGLAHQLCQILCNFKQEISGGLLLDILDHIQDDTDVDDVVMLIEMLEYLVFEPNRYFLGSRSQALHASETVQKSGPNPKGKLSKEVKVTEAEFGKVLQKLNGALNSMMEYIKEQDDRLILRLYMALISLIDTVATGKAKTKNTSDSLDTCLRNYVDLFRLMKCTSQVDYEEVYFYLQTLQLLSEWTKEAFVLAAERVDVINLIKIFEKIRDSLPAVPDIVFKQWKEQLAEVALLATSDGIYYQKDTVDLVTCLPRVNQTFAFLNIANDIETNMKCSEITQFANSIGQIKNDLEIMLRNVYQHRMDQLRLKAAESIVNLRWNFYQDHMMMLCSSPIEDLSQLDDWLGFLRKNLSLIKGNELEALLHHLQIMPVQNEKERKDLTSIILGALRKFNPKEMLGFLEYVVKHHESEELFQVGEDVRFPMKLVSVFNKLANITDTEKAVAEVCVLAIQSPRKTLQKILHDSVDNPGQQPVLVKLLQNVPTLCYLQDKVDVSSVGTILAQLFVDIHRNEKKLMSYNKLLTRLLKGHLLLNGRSVIAPDNFLLSTVLPHLSEDSDVELTSVLQLLLTILQSREDLSWLTNHEVFPIILTLCHIIDDIGNSDHDDQSKRFNVKRLVVSCLARIEKLLFQLQIGQYGKHVKWLCNSLKETHWTTALYVMKITKQIPGCLHSLPTSLEPFLGGNISYSFNVPDSGLLAALIEFVMTSDETLRIALEEADPSVLYDDPLSLHQEIVIILAEKFKGRTGREWIRVSELIQYLVRNEAVAVTIRPTARDTVPCLNMKDFRALFGTAQIFWEMMILATRGSRDNDLNHNVICQDYVGVIKAILGHQKNEQDISIEQAFLLSHLFCQNCFLMCEMNYESQETLLVLLLDILNDYSKISANVLKQRSNAIRIEIAEQRTAMEKAIQLTPNAQQETLLKKIHR